MLVIIVIVVVIVLEIGMRIRVAITVRRVHGVKIVKVVQRPRTARAAFESSWPRDCLRCSET